MIEVENINHSVNQCHMMKRVKKKPCSFREFVRSVTRSHGRYYFVTWQDAKLKRTILSPLHFNTETARSQYTLDFLYLIILYSA